MIKKIYCDVLVVGAGPAGLSASKILSKNGLNVICIEKKRSLKQGIKCAEGIAANLLNYLPYEIPDFCFEWHIEGIKFFAEGSNLVKKGDYWEGFSLNRAIFQEWLYKSIFGKFTLLLNSDLVDLEFDSNYIVSKAKVRSGLKIIHIFPKKIVAADGVESKTMTLLNLYSINSSSLATVYSWELSNLSLKNPTLEHIYFGDFAPSGYAYIFPKSPSVANVGVGSMKVSENLDQFYEAFLQVPEVAQQIKNGKKIVEKSKKASFDYCLKSFVKGNVIAVGDSANQNFKPFIEGILPSCICGCVVGDYISNNINSNLSEKIYLDLVDKALPGMFKESDNLLNSLKKIFLIDQKVQASKLFSLIKNLD